MQMQESTFQPNTPAPEKVPSIIGYVKEIVKFVLLALAIVIPFRIFIAQPFIVSGGSMDPTFADKQYLIVDEVSYRFEEPRRGDVIIFKAPPSALILAGMNPNSTVYYIKRIIGLPNETVRMNGDTLTIFNTEHPEGAILNEPYVVNHQGNSFEKKLESGEYFVMGDNRPWSSDSRAWGILKRENIQGKPIVRLLPLHTFSLFPGMQTLEQK